MKNPKQTRMCVKCRKRLHQSQMLRLQSDGNSLCSFSGSGRSFYMCEACATHPKALQSILKICKLKPSDSHIQALKEIVDLWKK